MIEFLRQLLQVKTIKICLINPELLDDPETLKVLTEFLHVFVIRTTKVDTMKFIETGIPLIKRKSINP